VRQQEAYRQTRQLQLKLCATPRFLFKGNIADCMLLYSLLKTVKIIGVSNAGVYMDKLLCCCEEAVLLCVTEYFAKSLKVTEGHSK